MKLAANSQPHFLVLFRMSWMFAIGSFGLAGVWNSSLFFSAVSPRLAIILAIIS